MSEPDDRSEADDQLLCVACEMPVRSYITADGDPWHPICLMEAHPQFEKREKKRCPECQGQTPYRPMSYPPEARSCPFCVSVFPEDAPRREDVTFDETLAEP